MLLCLTLSWLKGKKEKTLAERVPLDNLAQPSQRTPAAFFRTTRQTDIWLLAGILLLMGLAFWMILPNLATFCYGEDLARLPRWIRSPLLPRPASSLLWSL